MKHRFSHPLAEVEAHELMNGKRRVTVRLHNPALFMPFDSCETAYPLELIQAVLDVKGPQYLCDEILRDENPAYVRLSLERDLRAYCDLGCFRRKRILDFGCGAGASTLSLAKLFPEAEIVGVEVDERLLALAERRAKHYGFPHVVLLHSPSPFELPAGIGDFDHVVLSAVYEHLLPQERTCVLPLIWSVIKPNGYLFLNQTPHRYFPYESHTTSLPFINYLPDILALAYARACSKRVRRDESWEGLLRDGVRGATEREILRILSGGDGGRPILLEPLTDGLHDRIDLWYSTLNPLRYRAIKRAIRFGLHLLKAVSGVTLVPNLSLLIQKVPVKVCFISPLGYGLYNRAGGYPFGGAEVQFYLLAHALASDPQFAATMLTTVREEAGVEHDGLLRVVKRKGQGRLSSGGLRGYMAAFLDMRRQLRAIGADVYLHAGAGVEVGAYALLCRLLRRRFVFVVASSADLRRPNGQVQGPLALLYSAGVRLADAVVCRTHEQLAWLRSCYGRAGVLIRTGHRVVEHPPERQAYQEKTTVLWVGRMHPLKQPEMFLDLAERLPKESCVLVIMRDPAHEHLLHALRARATALANVRLHENVPWNEMDGHFARAKLLVNTSTYEGFPNTFVQAAMHGTPILSWRVDPDGVLTRHGIGICADSSFDRLAAAAEELCASDEKRTELGRQAQAYARAHHDVNRSAEELKALVRALVGGREAA